MGTPFKLKSGNTTSFKNMGSSPILKNEIYKTYIDESGNEKTENLGTGLFAETEADKVKLQNKRDTATALNKQKDAISERTGKTYDVKTEEGRNEYTMDMSQEEYEDHQGTKSGGSAESGTLTYTGADADKILSLSPSDQKAWHKANPHAIVQGSGGIQTSTKEMNKKVEESNKLKNV